MNFCANCVKFKPPERIRTALLIFFPALSDLRDFAEILNKLFGLDGLNIELCGSWLWITGNTYTHREAIKAAGCKWSKNKQAWYWHKGEYTRRGRRRYDMDEIRAMHGSETIRGSAPHRLTV